MPRVSIGIAHPPPLLPPRHNVAALPLSWVSPTTRTTRNGHELEQYLVSESHLCDANNNECAACAGKQDMAVGGGGLNDLCLLMRW